MIIQKDELIQKLTNIFNQHKVPTSATEKLLEILIDSHLKGYPSHGIARVPMYINSIKDGTIDTSSRIVIEKEFNSSLMIDCNRGIGPLNLLEVADLVAVKAERYGVAVASCKNCNDIARLGTYVERLAEQNLIGLLFVNDGGANPAVSPFGFNAPFFSTNPIAAGIPTNLDHNIVIDISTSVTALGKLRQKASYNESVQKGILVNRDGSSNCDPSSFFNKESAILPLGGVDFGHKGYCLSLLTDILSGALSGNGTSYKKGSIESNGICMIAINPEFFIGLDDFLKETTELCLRLKDFSNGSVYIPGEKSLKIESNKGLEIDPDTMESIGRLEVKK